MSEQVCSYCHKLGSWMSALGRYYFCSISHEKLWRYEEYKKEKAAWDKNEKKESDAYFKKYGKPRPGYAFVKIGETP